MRRSSTNSALTGDINSEFTRLVSTLSDLGMSQKAVAEHLGISAGQLSRVKRGEREAPLRHVNALKRLVEKRGIELKTNRKRLPFFSIDHSVLAKLSAIEATKVFRDLLWARAASRGVPRTKVNISEEINTPDGGVDASISDGAGVDDDLLVATGTRFQVKAGNAEPWQLAWVKKELFGKRKPQAAENLERAVRQGLEERRRYVLVCFGVDLVDEKCRRAVKNFRSEFKACGYPDAEVEVWSQCQLIGLFQQYPSLCLRLLGHDQLGFQTHDTWSRNADMLPTLHVSPEQQSLIDEVGRLLLTGETPHIRLIGEPGVGKTRLALEATRGELSPVVLYFSDGARFQYSSGFINELIQPDDDRFVVLVIDDCNGKDRASIWNLLKMRARNTRLITIDHDPDDLAGDAKVMQIPNVDDEQIKAILVDHGVPTGDADRWAEFCKGCPRVAHAIGENLAHNRDDLFQEPAETNIWDRFIVGHDDPHSVEVELRKIVLRHVALFERFGFERPVNEEAAFIARLASHADPRITPGKFEGIVHGLKQRRILQGTTTLYLTPRLLHTYLYRDFWQHHGRDFDITGHFHSMPPQLWHWFVGMLPYAHLSPVAEAAVDELLGPRGMFPGASFPDTRENGQLVMALAETNPKPTLRFLKRAIGSCDSAYPRQFKASRQFIIWALQRIAVSAELFRDAAELLLALAEAEETKAAGGATETFAGLFSLIPQMAPTEAPPSHRFAVLADTLESDSHLRREVALAACHCALSTHGGYRIVGPEHQGLRRTKEFWMPNTWGELWDAHHEIWQLLQEKLSEWHGDQRRQLIKTIVDSAWSTLHIPPLMANVLDTLEAIANDPMTDVKSLVTFAKRQMRAKNSELSEDARARLRALSDRLDGHDFASKLHRFVQHATFEDAFNGENSVTDFVSQKLEELAHEAVERGLLAAELGWLVRENGSPAFSFGFRIGKRDPSRHFLTEVLNHYVEQGEDAKCSFLGGYLNSIHEDDPSGWEREILKLADRPVLARRYSDFVMASGMSDLAARKVMELCRAGIQEIELLQNWWFLPQLRQLSEDVFVALIELQLNSGRASVWRNAVRMYHTYYLHGNRTGRLPEHRTFALLTHGSLAEDPCAESVGYYWSQLAAAFVEQYPERTLEFFRQVLRKGTLSWSVLDHLDANQEQLLTTILRRDPERAWKCIAEVFDEAEDREFSGIYRWLSGGAHRLIGDNSPGPIQFVPAPQLFDWVDQDREERAVWLAGLLPKTLDKSPAGRLTRDFIAKYGRSRRVAESLWAHFHSRGWCGSASEYYRKLRDDARLWLSEENQITVSRWISDYIDGLEHDIKRAEIEEERRF